MDDDESEVIKCLELFGWSWVGQALTITTILEYIESGERWFKYSDGHQVTTLGTVVIAKFGEFLFYFYSNITVSIFNVSCSMSCLIWDGWKWMMFVTFHFPSR